MNIILCEKNYFESNWCRQILSGLKNEFKKRRMEYEILFEPVPLPGDTMLYVIGSDYHWMSEAVCHANAHGITPIVVFNQLHHGISGRYHSVSSDINGTLRSLMDGLRAEGKRKICLYGINPSSASDIGRSESYFNHLTESGKAFVNSGSLQKCFDDFLQSGEDFDTVICTNDLAAVSLVKHLMEQDRARLEQLTIVSCSRSAISACYGTRIRSVNVNFTSFGTNAYAISRIIAHGQNIAEVALTVQWDMSFGDTPSPAREAHHAREDNGFYEDPEFAALLKLDRLLEGCDALDKRIIGAMLEDKTYAEIAEMCYMAEQSVKYRVKHYIEVCRLQNRRELLALLNAYHIQSFS